MKLKALGTRVIVKVDEAMAKTEGGLILPESAKTTIPEGTVISIGGGVTEVKVGERVMFKKHAGMEVESGVLLMAESSLIGVIE